PACAPADAAAREEPHRRGAAIQVPHARPGRDARALQRDRADSGFSPPRLSRLVRDEDVPPLPAAAADANAARRRRLDHGALLPAGHRRARNARSAATTRFVKVMRVSCRLTTAGALACVVLAGCGGDGT